MLGAEQCEVLLADVLSGGLSDEAAAVKYEDPVAQADELLEVCRCQNYGQSICGEAPNDVGDLLFGQGVHALGGFIQKQRGSAEPCGTGDDYFLLVSS